MRSSKHLPVHRGAAILLRRWYDSLYQHYGPQGWWPAESEFEVILGAILTQNTNWVNVEKALLRLKQRGLLSAKKLRRVPIRRLAALIRPAGYYNIKARRITAFLEFLDQEYGGSLRKMSREPAAALRQRLLEVNGIGPETADSILLYAFGKPVFVVDAYTRRVLSRHRLIPDDASYEQVQDLFMKNVRRGPQRYNEYHALLVRVAKEQCTKREARCAQCPLSQTR